MISVILKVSLCNGKVGVACWSTTQVIKGLKQQRRRRQ